VTAGIVIDGVSKVYDDGTQALDPIDLVVERGELVTLVGPSGCGKTTLLRIVSGLLGPTTGRVTVEPSIGYVFQDATLLPWRTVQRNVELPGELHGVPAVERRAAAARALGTVGLTSSAHLYPKALSGGMKMRASLARALTLEPDVFLFDEPFGALDEITRERLNDELLRVFEERAFAGLFVTHSVQEAVFLGTRVVVMSARPGILLTDVQVTFPSPRTPELRYEPAFAALCGEVSGALRAGSE
jgi:NitT/TauT family transport system ATP-binding protein